MATKSLLHFEGVDASTTFTDEISANIWTPAGNAQIDTAQFKFGSASGLFDGSGDYVDGPSGLYPTQDAWTLECFARFVNFTAGHPIISVNSGASLFLGPSSFSGGGAQSTTKLALSSNNSTWDINNTNGATTLSVDTWYHFALVFSGTTYKLFIGGTEEISVTSSTKIYSTSKTLKLGRFSSDVWYHHGWIDEFRFSDTAIYTANFTPPAAPFGLPSTGQFFSCF